MSNRLLVLLLPCLLQNLHLSGQSPPGGPFEQQVRDLAADLRDLTRRYDVPLSTECWQRMNSYLTQKLTELSQVDGSKLGRDGRIDLQLCIGHCKHQLALLDQTATNNKAAAPLLPHAAPLIRACERRRRLETIDGEAAAMLLTQAATALQAAERQLANGEFDSLSIPTASTATDSLQQLHHACSAWFRFYDGYDPLFSWWARKPWQEYDAAQQHWRNAIEQRLITARNQDNTLPGQPIGEAALRTELQHEQIPYTPAELIAIAEREFSWCDAEMEKASKTLGCGTNWQQAMELVKQRHVAPGEQPQLILKLAHEAEQFLTERDLLTLPPLATECWRMSMMSKAAQKVNPFFLGGNTIQVSFPTDDMTHQEKLQSLRSNNEHFCRATVFHELIPGHWLQEYMQERWRPHRAMFETPFWIEGWALYWEMRFYDLGLHKTAEDKVGALYWRKHRCARIIFSLNFHLGRLTAQECVEYLILRVGHERAAAEGEVRRSIGGAYSPLYQCAYLLGGLQLRALQKELVGSGSLTEKQFHDAVLQQNAIPIAYVRAALSPHIVPIGELAAWRF
ncbi:MAG: DUF885 family protein [Planctomycetota bacterium]|nr:DUF885 family protein [Planctomycetota bacterium]MSR38080.1 DUF885 family protein [Planctomycetota bacterium]